MPVFPPRIRGSLALVLAAVVLCLQGCGRQEPTFFGSGAVGSIHVVSMPTGARVYLDEVDSGERTPTTLKNVELGLRTVRVELDGFSSDPSSHSITVRPGMPAEVVFSLQAIASGTPRVALVESFSNVDCDGCDDANAALHALELAPGYGYDRVVLLKFSMNWPQPADPHYQHNTEANDARLAYYQGTALTVGIPTVVINGVLVGKSGTAPTLATLKSTVDSFDGDDAGFAITATAIVNTSTADATITLNAERDVDLSNCVLRVALAEDVASHDSAPGSKGETEFHWVVRDLTTVSDLPASLTASVSVQRMVHFTRSPVTWNEGSLQVVAFIQRETDEVVLQAGSSSSP